MTIDAKTLRNVRLFATLEEPSGFQITNAVEQPFQRGAVIVRAQEPARSVFIVREGGVKEMQVTPEGKEVILALHGPGDLFGEMATFNGNTAPTTAVAVTSSRVLVVPREDWLQLL